jgi:resuscitation-promoting factor RpfB
VHRTVKYGLYAVVLAGVVGGTVAWAHIDKTIHLKVDGNGRSVHTTAATVRGTLSDAGFTAGPHDIVAPPVNAKVRNGSDIVVKRGRLLRLTIDGKEVDVWTTAPTVAEALAELGYDTADFSSVSRDKRLPLSPTDIELRTPKTVTVKADGRTQTALTTDSTVADLLNDLSITVGATDKISVPMSADLTDKLTVVIQRVKNTRVTEQRRVPFPTKVINDPTLAKGVTRIVSPGRPGILSVTYAIVYVDGKLVGKTEISRKLLQAPITQLQRNGTKAPPPASTGSSSPTPSSGPIVVDPNSAQGIAQKMVAARGWSDSDFSCLVTMWDHESGWRVNATNPYTGAYGIPQALPGSKMATVGADWQTNPATQITWGLNYIQGRYGTPCNAWAFWNSHSPGWY